MTLAPMVAAPCTRRGGARCLRAGLRAGVLLTLSSCGGASPGSEGGGSSGSGSSSGSGTESGGDSEVSSVVSSFTTADPQSTTEPPTSGPTTDDPTASSPEPGLRYAGYAVPEDIEVLPDFAALEPATEGVVPYFDTSVGPSEDYFALVFEGAIEVPAEGEYTFWLTSDDGSKLFLDGDVLIDADGLHAATDAFEGTITLAAGPVPLRVEFFDAAGEAVITIEWEGPDIERQALPAEVLSTRA